MKKQLGSSELKKRKLWRCSKCGRRFANQNQSHSCGTYTVKDFLTGKSRQAIALYKSFEKFVRECGSVMLAPAKTRVGFQARMIFAAVNKVSDSGLKAHVVLARRLPNSRFTRIESFSPRNHVHHFEVCSVKDLDDEMRSWLKEAFSVGMQEHLAKKISQV